jgi:hypothetical protein
MTQSFDHILSGTEFRSEMSTAPMEGGLLDSRIMRESTAAILTAAILGE